MGQKLLWTGVVFMLAITPALKAFGATVNNDALVLVGAIIAVIGLVLYWLDK